MDNLLQEANDAIQRIKNNEMEKNTVADFESGFTMGGKPILPPLMTYEKRMQMKILLLEAALEKKLMSDQKTVPCPTVEASTELPTPPKPSSENKETNTESPSVIEPLVVMGRFRQKLTVKHFEPQKFIPEPVVAEVVVENASMGPPQMAVELQSTTGIQKSSCVTGTEELPVLRRSHTCLDSTKLHHQLWRRNQLAGQRLMEVQKTPIKTPDSSESGSRVLKEESKVKPRSKIPLIQKKAKIIETLPYITPGHEACYEPTPPTSVRCQSAAERRKNYDQKVAIGRNNMAKKREESLAKQKVVPKPNLPKSIRTPLSEPARLELQEQRKRFQSMVARQADEQKYLQAELEKTQRELMDNILGDLIHVTSEVSADYPSEMETALGSCSAATIASCNNTNSISPS